MRKEWADFIDSGRIEQYVLGLSNPEEDREVEYMSATYPEVKDALLQAETRLEKSMNTSPVAPPPSIKPFLMALIDYMNRMEQGEPYSEAPILSAQSTAAEFTPWLQREDMQLPAHAGDLYAKIISHSQLATTAIVWLKDRAAEEVHEKEYEKFLVLEGSCEITIGSEMHALDAGDFLAIPLFEKHVIRVTSPIPCKVILQRIAA